MDSQGNPPIEGVYENPPECATEFCTCRGVPYLCWLRTDFGEDQFPRAIASSKAFRLLFGISGLTAILMSAGWVAVVCSAMFLPGGHPPLWALVAIAVVIASWLLGAVGVLTGLMSLHKTGRRKVGWLFVCLNAAFLAFSVLVNFM